MQLNVKGEEAYRLASELAAETGEKLADAVRMALRERLERVRGDRAERRARILENLKEYSAQIRAAEEAHYGRVLSQEEWDAILYDENGLPR